MINFKNSKGKNISQDLSQLFSLQQWYYPFASLFFIEFFMHSSCHNIQKLRISVKYISSYDA